MQGLIVFLPYDETETFHMKGKYEIVTLIYRMGGAIQAGFLVWLRSVLQVQIITCVEEILKMYLSICKHVVVTQSLGMTVVDRVVSFTLTRSRRLPFMLFIL